MSLERATPATAAVSAVFLAAFTLFAFGTSQREIWRGDEHRYVEVGRVMTTANGSWVVPHLNGEPYPHKPPLFFWGVATFIGLGLEPGRAGMAVSASASAFTVALCFALGRRWWGPREGLAAAVVLASSEMFLSLALRANLDALLTACITAALYAYWRAEQTREAGSDRALRWLLAAGTAAGLGVLVKGPVAIGIPLAVIAGHDLLLRRGLSGWDRGRALALVACLVPVLAWLATATAEGGSEYVRDLVLGHGVAHPLGLVNKVRPFWYYAHAFPAGFLPWALALPAALLSIGRPRRSADAFAIAWLLAPLLLLSMFPAKRHLYALPIHVGAALLVARWLCRTLLPSPRRRVMYSLSRLPITAWGLAALSIGVAAVAGALVLMSVRLDVLDGRQRLLALAASLGPACLAVALAAGVLLVAAGAALVRPPRQSGRLRPVLAFGVGVSLLLASSFHPAESEMQNVSRFYERVASLVRDDPLGVYGGKNWAANWMLQRECVSRVTSPADADEFKRAANGAPVWLVAEPNAFRKYGHPAGFREVIANDPGGGRPLVLLRGEARGLDYGMHKRRR